MWVVKVRVLLKLLVLSRGIEECVILGEAWLGLSHDSNRVRWVCRGGGERDLFKVSWCCVRRMTF